MKLSILVPSLLLSLITVLGSGAAPASAQTINAGINQPACFNFSSNMRYGADDSVTQGQVTSLQQFLVTQGNFDSSLIGSGHFGPVTLRSVTSFQSSHGLPATGYFGPMTRGVIASLQVSCSPIPVPTPVPPQSTVSLYNLNPQSAQTGATVSVTGFGFTNTNTILMDSGVVARDVPITSSVAIACTTSPLCHGGINQTLTFTVPTSLSPYCPAGSMCAMYMRLVTPGQYSITVMNDNGTSNILPLNVTSGSTGTNPLSISGLDTPSTLQVRQSGTWTVHVNALNNTGLHYSVVWGDEGQTTNASFMAPQPSIVQTSASFNHSYVTAGTYTPTFTVSNDNGQSVSTTNTITVSPVIYY